MDRAAERSSATAGARLTSRNPGQTPRAEKADKVEQSSAAQGAATVLKPSQPTRGADASPIVDRIDTALAERETTRPPRIPTQPDPAPAPTSAPEAPRPTPTGSPLTPRGDKSTLPPQPIVIEQHWQNTSEYAAMVKRPEVQATREKIQWAAEQYGISGEYLNNIAFLEGRYVDGADGTGNGDVNDRAGTPTMGTFQYLPSTFRTFAANAIAANPAAWSAIGISDVSQTSYTDTVQQALATAYAVKQSEAGRHWTTAAQALSMMGTPA